MRLSETNDKIYGEQDKWRTIWRTMNVSVMFYPALRYGPCVELSESESRDGVIEKYVRDYLMPVACDGSKSKYWYWQRFMAEDVDFKSCNNAYKELYDRQAFQKTIERVLVEIADTLRVLMKA